MRKALMSAVVCVSVFCLSFETIAAAFVLENTETAHRKVIKTRKYNKTQKYRKYSKRWWRRYQARLKRNRLLQARRRALRARPVRTAATAVDPSSLLLPWGQPVPAGWRRNSTKSGEVTFSIDEGRGSAAISVVGNATGETVDTGRHRKIGGVPTPTLRREVIDRMILEQGWIVNDYQKEIGGRSVFVVVAQAPARNGGTQSRMYYFTEADGRIYSLSTNSSPDVADRIAEESAKVINSLKPRSGEQAAIRE